MSDIKTVEQIIKSINRDFNGIVHKGPPRTELGDELVSLGSISLDFCCYGGLKPGRFVEFSGAEGSGKTTVACLAAAAYQRSHPDKFVLLVDVEGTFDPEWASKLGLKTEEQFIYYTTTEGQSGEVILNHTVDFMKSGQVGFIIIDSLPLLVPGYVQDEDNLEQKSMGGNARLLSDFTSRYTGLVKKNKIIVIGINQLRDNMTQYGDPFKTTGGRAWKHACSQRLMFKRGDFFGQDGEKVKKKDAQNPAGHFIEMYVLKNKDCPWDRKLGFTKLHYWKGIDYVSDLSEVAIYFNLIDNSSTGWYKLLDEEGNPLLDDEGKEVKINGKKKFVDYLKDHKEISGRLYHKVRDLMMEKGSTYISAFEEMLGVSTQFLVEAADNE